MNWILLWVCVSSYSVANVPLGYGTKSYSSFRGFSERKDIELFGGVSKLMDCYKKNEFVDRYFLIETKNVEEYTTKDGVKFDEWFRSIPTKEKP